MERIKLIKVALILADMTYEDFGAMHNVSRQAVYQVVIGKDRSSILEQVIEDFIDSGLQKLEAIKSQQEQPVSLSS